MKKAVIIGGGISGLTAGVLLSDSGYEVEIHESSGHLGGRAYSFTDRNSGLLLDNGQHIIMGCYQYTLNFLKKINSINKLDIQKILMLEYCDIEKNRFTLKCNNFPAPLHILSGLLKLPFITKRDIMNFFKFGLIIYSHRIFKNSISATAQEILKASNQRDIVNGYLWKPIIISAINANPDVVSGELFLNTIYELFFRNKAYSGIILPKTGLSQIFAEPALDLIKKKSGKIFTNSRITAIENSGNIISALINSRGETITGDTFISSIPQRSLLKIKGVENILDTNKLMNIKYSPIIGIYILLKGNPVSEKILFLQKTKLQVLFNKTKICNLESGGQLISLIISAADDMVDLEIKDLKKIIISELELIIPGLTENEILYLKIIKEKNATPILDYETNSIRLKTRTKAENFFLAGDWTDTGLPATIESAVKSAYSLLQIMK